MEIGDDMYRLKEDYEAEIEIKKSRFITYLHASFNEQDAKEYIQMIRKKHPNATHHCYAFIIGEQDEIQRSNDDGEPSGTAGLPMLECLSHRHMQDIVAVTVRYFGGIKLGAGGLIRAYSKSVANALQHAVITQKQRMKKYQLIFSYDLVGKIDYFFRNQEITLIDKVYEEMVTYTFLSKDDPSNELSELSSGAYLPEFMEDIIIDIPIQLHEN